MNSKTPPPTTTAPSGAWLRLQGFALVCQNNAGHSVTHHDPEQLAKDLGELLAQSAQLSAAQGEAERLRDIQKVIDDYERDYLKPRQLGFGGIVLPEIVRIIRANRGGA